MPIIKEKDLLNKVHLEPMPLNSAQFFELTPEKFELVEGYLFDPPHINETRLKLLSLLLINVGLKEAVQLAPEERWKEALRQVYGDKEKLMSYEEFLNWCDEDTLAEWVDGKVVFYSPASDSHQNLSDWLTSILRIYAESKDLGIVRSAPFQMKLAELKRGREPDIIFVAKDNLPRLKTTHLDGPADLVIEIISPESYLRDRGEKFAEYEIALVKEYWILDPEEKRADFFGLKEGRFERRKPKKGIYHSEVLKGFWLKVSWLWEPPYVLSTLKELGLKMIIL